MDKELIDKTFENKKNDRNRAKELLEKINKEFGEHPKIVTLDEFGITGRTAQRIRHAFQTKINDYAIAGTDWSDNHSDDQLGIRLPAYSSSEYEPNPATDKIKFSYSEGELKKSTGVIKENGNPIAIALHKTENFTSEDQGKINALRKEMKALGEELSSKF